MELLFLFGISLLYIAVGTLDFFEILKIISVMTQNSATDRFINIALLVIIISLFSKIGIFPFHFYIIDLYRTAHFYAIAIFSTLPKFIYFFYIYFFYKLLSILFLI